MNIIKFLSVACRSPMPKMCIKRKNTCGQKQPIREHFRGLLKKRGERCTLYGPVNFDMGYVCLLLYEITMWRKR